MKLMFFHANFCGKCKMWQPVVESVCKETGVELVDCDASNSLDLFEHFKVENLPTVILKDGDREKRIDGVIPENALKEEINKFKGA